MISWIYFPKSESPPQIVRDVVCVFEDTEIKVKKQPDEAVSNIVPFIVHPGLEAAGFEVETGKRADQAIKVPVLFGGNGLIARYFEADAWNRSEKMVAVEAGRGFSSSQFLKDLFQACMMHDVEYCVIAGRHQCCHGLAMQPFRTR